jgi:hypothetical protein
VQSVMTRPEFKADTVLSDAHVEAIAR